MLVSTRTCATLNRPASAQFDPTTWSFVTFTNTFPIFVAIVTCLWVYPAVLMDADFKQRSKFSLSVRDRVVMVGFGLHAHVNPKSTHLQSAFIPDRSYLFSRLIYKTDLQLPLDSMLYSYLEFNNEV
jgi:hypothetical protein